MRKGSWPGDQKGFLVVLPNNHTPYTKAVILIGIERGREGEWGDGHLCGLLRGGQTPRHLGG